MSVLSSRVSRIRHVGAPLICVSLMLMSCASPEAQLKANYKADLTRADSGDRESQLRVGVNNFFGFSHGDSSDGIRYYIPITQNFQNARRYFSSCADLGNTLCAAFAGMMLMGTSGGEPDPVRAVAYLRQGSASVVEANTALGTALLEGRGVSRNTPEGLYFLRRAADQNDPDALDKLASVYSDGLDGVNRAVLQASIFRERASNIRNERIRRMEAVRDSLADSAARQSRMSEDVRRAVFYSHLMGAVLAVGLGAAVAAGTNSLAVRPLFSSRAPQSGPDPASTYIILRMTGAIR